jgi:hypothetical protein
MLLDLMPWDPSILFVAVFAGLMMVGCVLLLRDAARRVRAVIKRGAVRQELAWFGWRLLGVCVGVLIIGAAIPFIFGTGLLLWILLGPSLSLLLLVLFLCLITDTPDQTSGCD